MRAVLLKVQFAILGFSVLCFSTAGSLSAAELVLPDLSRRVQDESGFLTPSEVSGLEQQVVALNDKYQIQFAIYLPRSLQGYEIEDFGIRLADRWRLGEKETDRGLILLVAPNERKMRVEVGYGLEGALTDLWSKRTLDGVLTPAFRSRRAFDGFQRFIQELDQQLARSPEDREAQEKAFRESTARRRKGASTGGSFGIFLIFVILTIIRFLSRLQGHGGHALHRRNGVWTSGSSGWGGGGFGSGGGGGFSGGGGGFGGGGASSNW